ncbi:MAG: Stk1 family PASTA domain-containing Ser/Thr kinase [Erysipelothrix sp.]|nr:Stk1 family PASTA domain-containing Ser/Thr kinase [Erysipelothrix sp.]
MLKIINERYKNIKKIGVGGMADVYLAHDELLDREVAVKILRGDLSSDPVHLMRFQREANAAIEISHPNIVEVYDVGQAEGQHYIVMEYVTGKTLKQLIHQRGALDLEESLVIMKQIIAGLSEAHKLNIVHRDIKPQNILIKDDGTVKIADFGIARAQGATQLTQVDSVMGSVHYMAPENARGESASIQSDLYAVGIVFYELLMGDVPFKAEAPMQVALKHMKDELPSIREFNPQIPQSVENIVIQATAKNKIFRYKTTEAMLADLETCMDPGRESEKPIVFDEDLGHTIIVDDFKAIEPKAKTSKFKTLLVAISTMSVIALGIWMAISFINVEKQPKMVVMPDISNLNFAEANDMLEELGLFLSTNVKYQLTDDVEFGKIISSNPPLDSEVEVGTTINVTISDGMFYIVENYAGLSLEEAQTKLADTRLIVRVEKEQNQDVKPGVVIRQEQLLPNDKIDPRIAREIKLIVSTYVEIVIPHLLGEDVQQAQTQLQELGVKVILNQLSTEDLSEDEIEALELGVVIHMDPQAGSLYSQFEENAIVLQYY